MADGAIAVIGMAGRFPGAPTVDRLWRNLRDGVESISTFTREELLDAGADPALVDDDRYVPRSGALEGADLFAASFFGFTAREALLTDPQQRLFLESSWEALENAGYGGARGSRSVGVFAGVSLSTYLLNRLIHRPDLLEAIVDIETTIGNDKDFLASRVAYKLDLHGPALVVQSACSSSLVAVHVARLSLLAGECDLALAGGTSVDVPQRAGHLYRPDGIYSSDGHCRPFDARADGMVGGSGTGVVVLKRLDEAIADRDTIRAVIRGSAVNNDGANKVGYSAPSVEAQAEVIAAAHRSAGVDAESIGFVEAHGTGTTLGDPIEVAALTQAFNTSRRGYCALGSLKSNLGHLNAAAGVTGLIKAVLAVEHGEIPASLHYETPNPHIDFENSPFFVNASLIDWPGDPTPRRAGVSSFGMGGTNAHVVLEQAPDVAATEGVSGPGLLVLSARTAAELAAAHERLAARLAETPRAALRDVAHTLQVGRRPFPIRSAVVASTVEEAIERLRSAEVADVRALSEPRVVFLFPGQGSQHPGMARDLYRRQAIFRREIDRCAELFGKRLDADLLELMFGDDEERLRRTAVTQSALFTVQYSLAILWRTLGVRPDALLGHSVGEYTAACVAGVFSLEDAVALVAERGRLLEERPAGAMLAVALPADELEGFLSAELVVAAINETGATVVSGPDAAVAELERRLGADRIPSRRLETSHAFHSPMMAPAATALREAVRRVEPSAPTIPFVSNVSGTWITPERAADPDYWAEQLVRPVRFLDGLDAVFERGADVLLEVGPGRTLTSLARRHRGRPPEVRLIASLPRPGEGVDGSEHFLSAVGELWSAGTELDWEALAAADPGRRVPLPSYPFERRSFWLAARHASRPAAAALGDPGGRLAPEHWCHVSSWSRLPGTGRSSVEPAPPERPVVVFDDNGTADALRRAWGGAVDVVSVRAARSFERPSSDEFLIDPWDPEHYDRLVDALPRRPLAVVHRWTESTDGEASSPRHRGFDSLVLAARQLGRRGQPVDWLVVTRSAHEVVGSERVEPLGALVAGPCRVIPYEYEGHRCRNVDLAADDDLDLEVAILLRELVSRDAHPVVAYRSGHRWCPGHAPLVTPGPEAARTAVPDGARCLVTGGTSGVGLALAEALSRVPGARVALLARTPLPARDTWDAVLASAPDARLGRTLRAIRRIEAAGSSVLTLAADVADRPALAAALERVRDELGGLDVVVHAAGVPGGGALEHKSLAAAWEVMAPKVQGTRHLWELTREDDLSALVLCSSLAAEIGGFGQVDYVAANAFQDAFAAAHRDDDSLRVIDWDTWSETGMAVDVPVPTALEAERAESLRLGLRTAEAQDLFLRVLASREPRVLVSTTPLAPRLAGGATARVPGSPASTGVTASPSDPYTGDTRNETPPTGEARPGEIGERPDLATGFVAPRTDLEESIAEIWRRLFGLARVGVDDDFFELGGHSLLATQLLNRLRSSFPTAELSLAALFEHPTIAGLASLVEAPTSPDEAAGDPRTGSLSRRRLTELEAPERTAVLEGHLAERLGLEADGAVDIGARLADICWLLRRDLSLAVYPHELRAATTLGQVAEIVGAIVAGESVPAALRPAPEEAPPTDTAKAADDRSAGPAPTARNERPIVFLLSAPRSGSTLLRLMLAGHPALFCPPELALLSAAGMREWRRRQLDLFARDGLTRSLMEIRGIPEAAARAQIAEMVREDRPIQRVYDDLQGELGARVLVDKSPAYALDPAALARAEELFAAPRYVVLTRHPAAVIDSCVRHRLEALLSRRPVDDPWRFAESVWTEANRNLAQLGERAGDRVLRLRYEDVVSSPEPATRRLADFLGLTWDEALLRPYDGGRMIDGPGDPDIFQHDGIDAALAEAWRSVRLPEPLLAETVALARDLGYAEPAAEPGEAPRAGLDAGQADDLLARLDELSDEEVAVTLGTLLDEEADS